MAVYNTSADAANTAVRAFLTRIGEYYLGKSFNTGSGKTQKDWLRIRDEFFEGKCAYCGKNDTKLQIEHLVMFNREEYGLHHPGNIVPVCTSCNKRSKSKDNKFRNWEDHLSFICDQNNEQGFYNERFNRIKSHIKEGQFKYPILSPEENHALRIITNNLYDSIKTEFEKAVKLFEDLDRAYSKK
jgi:hypothetical protein